LSGATCERIKRATVFDVTNFEPCDICFPSPAPTSDCGVGLGKQMSTYTKFGGPVISLIAGRFEPLANIAGLIMLFVQHANRWRVNSLSPDICRGQNLRRFLLNVLY
jgi:hypothetical protein